MSNAGTLRILLVEDDLHHAKTLQDYLTRRGHEVLRAEDAARATATVEYLGSEDPIQLAIVDLDLGSGKGNNDGLDLIRKFRRQKFQVPIIVLTGTGRSKAMRESFEAGANDFVHKGTSSGEQAILALDALYELAHRISQSSSGRPIEGWITFGTLVLDGAGGDIYVGGKIKEKMQPMPFRILHYIASRAGGASVDEIKRRCKVKSKESVYTHISQIRKVLPDAIVGGRLIIGDQWRTNYKLNKKKF